MWNESGILYYIVIYILNNISKAVGMISDIHFSLLCVFNEKRTRDSEHLTKLLRYVE